MHFHADAILGFHMETKLWGSGEGAKNPGWRFSPLCAPT